MTKPSDTAVQAAREILATDFYRDFTNPEYELATRIDAAAQAIVREKMAGLHELEKQWRKDTKKLWDDGDNGQSVQADVCANALHAALDKLERAK